MAFYRYRVIVKDRLYEDEGCATSMEAMIEMIHTMYAATDDVSLMYVEEYQQGMPLDFNL